MKTCTICGVSKKKSDFNWKVKNKGIRRSACKECTRLKDNEYYYSPDGKRKKQIIEGHWRSKKRASLYVFNYLKKHPCVDCGNNDIRVLDFDHVKGNKIDCIANMVKAGYSVRKLKQEIKKCKVRCSNCHRIKTSTTIWGSNLKIKPKEAGWSGGSL